MRLAAPFAAALLVARLATAGNELTFAVLAKTAYRTNPELAREADAAYSRAVEIGESGFKLGTAREFDTKLRRAAILGHVGAADLMCTMRSNEALGIAFFREGYAWCRIAQAHFQDTDAVAAQRLAERVAFVVLKLGKENLYLGREYEQYTLRTMQEVAGTATASH
jgi:hypothetical protein